MKGEEKKEEQPTVKYRYKKCNDCNIKYHVTTLQCPKCGKRFEGYDNVTYYSNKPEDAIYSYDYNHVEKCMSCFVVINNNNPCKHKYCFATGRGKCDNCREYSSMIFECCQEVQKKEGVVTSEDWRTLGEAIDNLGNRMTNPDMPEPAPQQEYADEIPF